MNLSKHAQLLLAALLGAALSSCADTSGSLTTTPVSSGSSQAPEPIPEPILYQWYDDNGPGQVAVRIKLSTQKASFTRGGRDIGWSYVATGTAGHRTPSGTFTISEMVVDKHSNRYGAMVDEFGTIVDGDAKSSDRVPPGLRYVAAPMPYWMRLTSYGIGMHAGPIPNPGSTASHGCIRLPRDFAPILYGAVKSGTPVTIVQ